MKMEWLFCLALSGLAIMSPSVRYEVHLECRVLHFE